MASDGLTLGELFAVLWSGRWVIAASASVAVLLAIFYVWRATPIYEVSALIQVDAKQISQAKPALEAKIDSLSEMSSQALGEAEILQSNQVLGRAVQALHLDLDTTPDTGTLLGTALVRRQKPAPVLEVEVFEVPEKLRGAEFSIKCLGNGAYEWRDPDDKVLARGQVGDVVAATWQGQPMSLKVRSLIGRQGQKFDLCRLHIQEAIRDLRESLTVAEKGKETNILILTLQYPQPERGAQILNAILDQYNNEDADRKTGEASKTLALIQEEMGQLRDKQLKAEQLLNATQAGARSTDLGEEARLALQRSVEIEKQVLELSQKKSELLRTYQEGSDVVGTVNQQINKLQEERQRLDNQVKSLPHTQQTVMRLMRDVQVNQEHYSSLMNLEALNTQQLQMAKAGEIGNARIVDYAMPSLKPVKPQRNIVLAIGLVLGALLGVGVVMLRRSLTRVGVEDPQVLESSFGLPVLATIPHSVNQDVLARKVRKVGEQIALLATDFPVDLAVESLRSLRTSLHFTMVDSPSRAIMIAGASPEIGKSFVSANFAGVLAQFGARVLLVDADMRKGTLHRHFGTKGRKDGLSEILAGSTTWQKVLRHGHGLDMISTGTLPPNPTRLLSGDRYGAFMAEVSKEYDYVIVDAPPVLAVADAAMVGAHVGAVVLLVKDGQHPLGEIRAALQSLELAGVQAKGFIFNDINPETVKFGYQRYAYYYGYQNT